MNRLFEELDYAPTPLGAVSLRRRRDPSLGVDVYEVKLGDDFLMSSLFTVSEIALARLGLAGLEAPGLEVVVGGLGLGYTAQAVLENPSVASLVVVEALAPVVSWHENGVLPIGRVLPDDPRCRIVVADFFALAASPDGFDPARPGRTFDAILVDIDHTPELLLSQGHAGFYEAAGLASLARHLRPGGVFGLWSNDPPDDAFTDRLSAVFEVAHAEAIGFPHPSRDETITQAVYLARTAAGPVTNGG